MKEPKTKLEDTSDIYDISYDCLLLFTDCLSTSRPGHVAIETSQQRFWAWSNVLNVFAEPRMSLDTQLRLDKYPQIRHLVLLLLNVLKNNLVLVVDSISSDDVVDISMVAAEQQALDVALFGIEGSLKRLEKVSAAILKATEGSLARRVFAYAEEKLDNEFKEHVSNVLKFRFSRAVPTPEGDLRFEEVMSPELKELLVDSFLHRHYRILYERRMRQGENPRVNEVSVRRREQHTATHLGVPSAGLQRQLEHEAGLLDQREQETTRSSIEKRPLTIDEGVAAKKLAESSAPPRPLTGTPSVSETGEALYPDPPVILEDQNRAECPICLKSLDADVFRGERWRIHVKQDVQPYVCISQDCSKNLQFFADAESWIDHMRRTHTSMWIRHLHNEVIWKCPLPHAQSMPQEYSTEDDLFSRHMTIEHADVSERKLHLLASSGAIPVPRAVDICPICGDTHIPVKRSKAHIQQEGVNSDSNSDSEESEEASKVIEVRRTPKVQFVLTPDPLEDAAAERPVMHKAPLPWDVQDHRRIEKYISKHLKALALYFTRYLLASKEDAGDAARARSLDDAFSNSLSDFIDPPPRPVESPWPTPFFHNEEAESISRQLIEHDIDPSWTVREKLHQWTDPPLEPSREQEWGFSKNTSLPPYEGHQGDSLLRPFVKRYQANQNSSSAVLSFHDFEVAMAKLFVPNESGQPSFVNSDFDEMRRLLGQVGMTEWSRRPRTYAVLNMIGRLEIFDDFISDGLADIALPYTSTQLPGYLTPGAGNRFLEMQYLVLNEAFDLELFPERLIHFIESAEVHFDFIKRLGRGHSGKVDHVMSKLSLKEYARKRMRRRILNYVRALEQLNNEISILKKLSHRHLVKFLGSYTDPSYVGLLMSPVAECDLKDFLDRYPSLEGDREPIRGFFGCLCSAVLYLHHSNIRHRGLKTSNILVYEGRVLITNLEEAHDWNDDELRSRTTLMTDPFEHIYAAPEVFNAESRNSSSDIWSLGCVYMEMMTVLRGETFTSQSIFFEENGDRRPIFYSPLAINDWLTHLQSDEDPEPLKWIRQMLQSVPQNRVTSSQLMAQIHNFNDPVYYDSCCGEKDDRKDT